MNLRFISLTLTLILLLSSLHVSLIVFAHAAANFEVVDVMWGYQNSPIEVSAGDKYVPLTIILQNSGKDVATAIRVSVTLSGPFTNITGGREVEGYHSGDLPPGYTAAITFLVNIDEDAKIGIYKFNATIKYLIVQSTRGITSYLEASPINISFNVKFLGKVNLQVLAGKTNLKPEELNSVTLTIRNLGSADASSVELFASLPSGLILENGDAYWLIGSIGAKNDKKIVLKLKPSSTLEGAITSIKFTINYRDAYGIKRSISRSLSFKVSSEKSDIEVVDYSWKPSEVSPGDDNLELSVTLQNRGTTTISGIRANLLLSYPFSSSSQLIGYYGVSLSPGSTATIKFKDISISKDAKLDDYELYISVSYLSFKGNMVEEKGPIPLKFSVAIKGKVLLDVSVSKDELIPDEENEFEIIVVNNGNGNASDVKLTVTLPTGISLVKGDNHFSLNELSANEVKKVNLKVFVSSALTGSALQLSLSISYKDAYGSEKSLTRVIGLKVSKKESKDLRVIKAQWGGQSSPLEVSPGDNNVLLTIILQNMGSNTISGIDAKLILSKPFTNTTNGNLVRASYGNPVSSGSNAILSFPLSIGKDAKLGSYKLKLNLTYIVLKGNLVDKVTQSLNVPVVIEGKPKLIAKVEPDSISPSAENELNIIIKNEGTGNASGVEITISLPPTLSLIDGKTKLTYKVIRPNEKVVNRLRVFAVSTIANNIVQISLNIIRRDNYGIVRSESQTLSLRVLPLELNILEVSVNENTLRAGSINTISFTVKNPTKNKVKDVVVSIAIPSPLSLVAGGSKWSIKSIKPDEEVKFNLKLFAPSISEGNSYQAQISLTYLDYQNVSRSETHTIGLIVTSIPEYFAVFADNSILSAERVNELNLIIKASEEAKDVIVTLAIPSSISLLTKSNKFLLKDFSKDEEKKIKLNLFVPQVLSGSPTQIQTSINYKTKDGSPRSETHSIGFVVKGWESPITLEVNQNELAAGKTNEPIITIKTKEELQSLSLTINLPTQAGIAPLILQSESNKWIFGKILKNDEVKIVPKLFTATDAADNTYNIQISLSYTDRQGVTHSETRTIGFLVKGEAKMIVLNPQAVPPVVQKGEAVTVSGTLLNKGTGSAFYTIARVKKSNVFKPTEEESVYLGEVVVNTPLPFSVTAKVSSNVKEGVYPLIIEFIYEDNYGKESKMELKVNIKVSEKVLVKERKEKEEVKSLDFLPQFLQPYSSYLTNPYILVTIVIVILAIIYAIKAKKDRDRIMKRIMEKGGQTEAT
jgi:uncharacterized repeat protein (TIGR01451 family)